MLGGIAVAAALTWILPAGEYDRRDDPVTGRRVVVAGTYHTVEPAPATLRDAIVAIPRGMVGAAEVIVSILLVGGAFALVDALGTLNRAARALVRRFHGRGLLAIPIVICMFATFGALENMQEEIVALVPVLLVLARGLGVDAVTAVAMSSGAAAVGAAFGPTNPFQAGISRKLAQLPLLSGAALGIGLLLACVLVWIFWTLRHARRNRIPMDTSAEVEAQPLSRQDKVILALVAIPLGIYVVGVLRFDWGFNELSGVFFVAAIAIGIVGGMGLSGGTAAYLKGMEQMVAPSVLVGIAYSISTVMRDGRVMDTVVRGLAAPLEGQQAQVAALLMIPVQFVLHVFVPSVSGQAVLTLPILVPLSDIIQLPRLATVFAYQTGAGLSELVTPTNGAIMAVLLSAGVPWTRWVRFAAGGVLVMALIGAVGTYLASR